MNTNAADHWYAKATIQTAQREQEPCRHNHCVNKGQVHEGRHTAHNGQQFDRSR